MKPTIISTNNDDKLIQHIIEQNDNFKSSYDSIKIELNELKNEKEFLENENEGMQKTRQVLIGYMKNLNELSKTESALRYNYYILYCSIYRFYVMILFSSILFYAMLLAIENIMVQVGFFTIYLTTLVILSKYIYNLDKKFKIINDVLFIEIKKIESANDLINDLLDNL